MQVLSSRVLPITRKTSSSQIKFDSHVSCKYVGYIRIVALTLMQMCGDIVDWQAQISPINQLTKSTTCINMQWNNSAISTFESKFSNLCKNGCNALACTKLCNCSYFKL